MKWLAFLFCYLACARGTLLLPLLLYNLMNPRQPATTQKPESPHYFIKVVHQSDHEDYQKHKGKYHDHDKHDDHEDYHDHHNYKVIKLDPPKIKVIPGLVKISDPVVKVKVKVSKDKDYEDHTDKYDY